MERWQSRCNPGKVCQSEYIRSNIMGLRSNIAWLANHPVTKQRPVRTWCRWTYWQTRQLFTRRPKVVPFSNNTKLTIYPHEDLTGYYYVGFPEYGEMVFLQRFLRPGDIFFDVGANAGAYAVLACGIGCEVTAIEPVPQTFAKLTENVSLNLKAGDITALNVAVSSAPGALRMTTGFGSGNHILQPGEQEDSVEVAVTTLDILTRNGHAPTFVKMDVEGHEVEVLKGTLSTLRSTELTGLLVETFRPHNWRNKSLQELESILRDNGFFPFGYDVESNDLFPLVHPQDGENNTFYFRSIDLIRERLAENFRQDISL